MLFQPAEPDTLPVLSVATGWSKRRKIILTDFVRERTDYRFASKLLSAALKQIEIRGSHEARYLGTLSID
jgi:hypothetical protein